MVDRKAGLGVVHAEPGQRGDKIICQIKIFRGEPAIGGEKLQGPPLPVHGDGHQMADGAVVQVTVPNRAGLKRKCLIVQKKMKVAVLMGPASARSSWA